jgi:endonuclease-3
MTPSDIDCFFQALSQANPDPQTELYFTNTYTLLIAVVLSAQATDRGVNAATRGLFPEVDTPQKMIDLGEDRLREAIRTIGLYPTKAKHILALSHRLIQHFGGHVPNTREALEQLPGVGRKTANVVLNVAFGQATIPVDTHVFRVANRTGLARGKTPLSVETALEACVPDPFRTQAHHVLILHGRYVCTARSPHCDCCPVRQWCAWPTREGKEGAISS